VRRAHGHHARPVCIGEEEREHVTPTRPVAPGDERCAAHAALMRRVAERRQRLVEKVLDRLAPIRAHAVVVHEVDRPRVREGESTGTPRSIRYAAHR